MFAFDRKQDQRAAGAPGSTSALPRSTRAPREGSPETSIPRGPSLHIGEGVTDQRRRYFDGAPIRRKYDGPVCEINPEDLDDPLLAGRGGSLPNTPSTPSLNKAYGDGVTYTNSLGKQSSIEDYRASIGTTPDPNVPKDYRPPEIKAASEWGNAADKWDDFEISVEDLFFIVGQSVADTAKGHEAELKSFISNLKPAFKAAKIDTIPAQAVYLAHSAGETIFATLTEGQKNPFEEDPEKVKETRDPRGPLRYKGKTSIDPLNKIDADKNPTYADTFIGRGPVQVTHGYNYMQTLIYMEELAKQAKDDEKALLEEAITAIKKDPRQAANPKYSFLFSAAFMQMSGGVKASGSLTGKATFSGQDTA